MAITGRFRVSMGDVFPQGAFVVGEVEAVRDFEKSVKDRPVQARDRESGELVWSVPVLDADELAPKGVKTVVVKIAAPVQPVPPEAVEVHGMKFRAVEFEGPIRQRLWVPARVLGVIRVYRLTIPDWRLRTGNREGYPSWWPRGPRERRSRDDAGGPSDRTAICSGVPVLPA